ncbi:MAG: cation:proton antiporter [Solirubrobacteraceae bacterium]
MAQTQFTNLLIVVVVAFAAPFALGLVPRLRLPAVVLEIVAGIAIGPSGLGWVQIDEPVRILSLIGLAFLLFLAGLEIDVQRLRGRTLRITSIGFLVSLLIGVGVGVAFRAGGLVRSPLFIAIVLSSTSLGVIVPVLKDSGNVGSSFGQLVIAGASIADFGAIILLSLFFSGQGSTDTTGKLILLGLFAVLVAVIGFAIRGFERSDRLSSVLPSLQDTTAQIRVRGAFVLLIGFVALAEQVGLETILGAFAAGALLSLVDRDEAMTHPLLRLKLEAAGFGLFIPGFFIASGLRFDLNALFSSASTVARVPLFLLALLAVRGIPALLYSSQIGHRQAAIAGLLQSTSLPFIVTATMIGQQIGVVSKPTAAGLIAAGLLSVILFPLTGLSLLRRGAPIGAEPVEAMRSASSPILSAEDRALCRLSNQPAMEAM